MVPPDGFVGATAFPGFQHDETGSSLVVAEIPGSYGTIVDGMTEQGLATRGITLTGRTDITIDGRPSLLLEGTQQGQGGTVGKVVLVTGTEDLTAVVTGNYPIGDSRIGAAVRSALLTTSFDPDRPTDPQAALGFTLTPAPPLAFAGSVVNCAIYNTSAVVPSADPREPSLLVCPSLGSVDTTDLAALARAQLLGLASISNVIVESPKDVTIAGLPGIELTGTAKRSTGSDEVFVYELLLRTGSGFVAMIGACPLERRAECLDAYQQTVRTYRPRS